ncbi:ribosome silencing factor [Candidatus Endobugula sertula]|uniref:Ribosomal silencing factor RsfS n=1 Tax=Candidatus Endobugula sertula TaxID=62101 RepID=A0A1D2QQC8_9GAMM|nr:ribosome silencing factor [Candidatus Endobugula sertula]
MTDEIAQSAIAALDDLKGQNIVTLDVTSLSDVMDILIIATGTSNRHVKSLANYVVEELKKQGHQPIGIEGMNYADWALLDYGTSVVHIMLSQTRQFYDLEKLWAPIDPVVGSEEE